MKVINATEGNYSTVDYKIDKKRLSRDKESIGPHRQLPFYKVLTRLFLLGLLLSLLGNIYLGLNSSRLKRNFEERLESLRGLASSGIINLNEIQVNPGKFIGKKVVVHGFVTYIWPVSFFNRCFYRVIDGTGAIWVFTTERIPLVNSAVKIKGGLARIGGNPPGETDKGAFLVQYDYKYLE